MTQITHKQLSDNAKFIASTYSKGSRLNKIYTKISKKEFIKSIVKLEWLFNSKN